MADYFGTYAKFQVASKSDAGLLLGADNMVGDVYDVSLELVDGVHKAWLDNRFGQRIGYFDEKTSRKLGLLSADGLVEKAILSFVAFSNKVDEGSYWGEAALICYKPAYASEFDTFIEGVSKKIGDDVRPKIDFDREGVDKVIESGGQWTPTQSVSLPENNKDMAVIKRRRSVTDKLVEQGRAGNKGCYVASWVVLLAVVALIVFGLKSCFGW